MDVRAIQRRLTGLGYEIAGVRLGGDGVDGAHGPLTTAAVQDFQGKHGMPATGKMDQATAAALFSEVLDHPGASGNLKLDAAGRDALARRRGAADPLSEADLSASEAAVNLTTARSATQDQFNAMVSLASDIGAAPFSWSSVAANFNEGRISSAGASFLLWGAEDELDRPFEESRRKDERAQFLRG